MSDWVDDIGLSPDEQARLDAAYRRLSKMVAPDLVASSTLREASGEGNESVTGAATSVGIGRERAGDCAAIPTTSAREQTNAPSPASVASAVRPHEPADAPPALRWGWRYAQDGLWQLVLEDVT